jgi:resuscitation-promoting factor RpfB
VSHPQPSVKTPVGDAPVVPLFLIGTGMYLAWFGVHYFGSDVKWPTDPIKAVLQGKSLPADTQSQSPEQKAVLASAQAQLAGQTGVTPGTGEANPNALGQAVASGAGPAGSGSAANQATGKLLAAGYGWSTGTQWDTLVQLWNQESGWSNIAQNATSGAYGIPQALPYTKMPQAAWPPSAGGRADPTSQIQWGLAYIRQRYGSPSAAWAHEQANNWY